MLLAKSVRPGRTPLTLAQHLADTEHAARQVFRLDGRWGEAFARFLRIGAADERERLLLHVRIAALFHDVGKANDGFQTAVTKPGRQQVIRHEHLGAFLLLVPEIQEWLSRAPTLDDDVIIAAVLSHHLKAAESGPWRWGQPQNPGRIELLLDHPEVRATLERVGNLLEIGQPPTLRYSTWSHEAPWTELWRQGRDRADDLRRSVRRDSRRKSLLVGTKVGVIVADSVASALVREGHPIDTWIEDVVHAAPLTGDDLRRDVIEPRLAQLSNKAGRPVTTRPFQERLASVGPRALLLAACGSGKTLAAWRWAEEQLRTRPTGRVLFLYPTRGTSTEGFRDYVSWAPEARAALLHSSSRYELDAMARNPSESTLGKTFVDEEAERLFALGLWSKRYFSATVDQFLAFLEHRYESLCLMPALADSVVIIDEVHSFDRNLFKNLVAFLRNFDLPVLCMTATLPLARRQQLEDEGLIAFPGTADREELAELQALETALRYVHAAVDDEEAARRIAIDAYADGQRVLWVVNTVDRCRRIADDLEREQDLDGPVLSYHSRFKLEDRQTIHNETVAAFQQMNRRSLAVTTQVCEMSLDLDADVLISEVASPSALVQRFGRSNRHLARGESFRSRLVTYDPSSTRPYTSAEMDAGRSFLAELGHRELSQRDLAEALERHAVPEAKADGSARLLEGGYFAVPGSLRDEADHLRQAILDTDLADLVAAGARRVPEGLLVPVPRRAVIEDDSRPSWLPAYVCVAPGQLYNSRRGFGASDE